MQIFINLVESLNSPVYSAPPCISSWVHQVVVDDSREPCLVYSSWPSSYHTWQQSISLSHHLLLTYQVVQIAWSVTWPSVFRYCCHLEQHPCMPAMHCTQWEITHWTSHSRTVFFHQLIEKWMNVSALRWFRDTVIWYCALTLLVGHQEEHPSCKNWVIRYRCGCLSVVRCRLFAYDHMVSLPS